MAISIVEQPDASRWVRAGNPMTLIVSSNLTAQPNFRYVVDIQNIGGSQTYARLKADKVPAFVNPTTEALAQVNKGLFDVRKAIQTIMLPPLSPIGELIDANPYEIHTGMQAQYRLRVAEEYGTPPTVQASSYFYISGYALRSSFDQYDVEGTTNMGSWNASGSSQNGLTNGWEVETHPVVGNLNTVRCSFDYREHRFFSFWSSNSSCFVRLIYYDKNGTAVRNVRLYQKPSVTSALTNRNIIIVKIGLYYINNLPSTCFSDGQAGSFQMGAVLDEGFLAFYPEDSAANARTKTYVVKRSGECYKYGLQTLHWVNQYGGVDSYGFDMKSQQTSQISRFQYTAARSIVMRKDAKETYGATYEYKYTLRTDWLTDAQFVWFHQLFRSPKIWIQIGDKLFDAVVDDTSFTFNKKVNTKLTQLTIKVTMATPNSIL